MNEFLDSLARLFLGPQAQDDPNVSAHWVGMSDWSHWQEWLIVALVVLILAITIWNLRRAPTALSKIVLFVLRTGALAVLLFVFYQPAIVEETRARSTNTIVLLADDSSSMALPHKESSRREMVASFVQGNNTFWRRVEQSNVLESYRFSDKLVATDWRDLGKALDASGEHTHIIESLEALRDRYRNRDVGGVLLLSDGIDNGRGGRVLQQAGNLDRETLRLIKGFNAPIFTFGLQGENIRDVSVQELRYSPFAFKRNRATIEADIQVHGFPTGMLNVELLEEGRLLRSTKRALRHGQHRYTASFDFIPEVLGHRVYTVRASPLKNEVSLENNERHAVIRIGRDKIRVLQIAGHPSWDVRFVRNHLKRTPNIQLISFFILIRAGSTLGIVDSKETSLIPFPADELFVNELGGFDLVLLQDFNYGPFSTPQHLFRVRDYVKQGGALLMIGGRLGFGAGGYAGTELEEILPVKMVRPGFDDDALDTTYFKPRLSKTGLTHSITRLSLNPAENKTLWSSLPSLEGVNKFSGLTHGGISLVEHPALKSANGRPMPVIAINEVEDGRVAVVGTDSLWRWKLEHVGKGGDDRHYDQILSNTVKWLIKDPDLNLVKVSPSAGVRALGESVDLEVRIFTPDYKTANGLRFELKISRRQGLLEGESPTVVYESKGENTNEQGRWSLTRTPSRAGVYDVTAIAKISGRRIEAKTVFVVSDERPEMRQVHSNTQLMDRIARATGGKSLSLSDRKLALDFNPPRVSEVTNRRYHERWNLPGIFFLGCVLFGLEWWLRRRWGFL